MRAELIGFIQAECYVSVADIYCKEHRVFPELGVIFTQKGTEMLNVQCKFYHAAEFCKLWRGGIKRSQLGKNTENKLKVVNSDKNQKRK
jgi:hypothetical protein